MRRASQTALLRVLDHHAATLNGSHQHRPDPIVGPIAHALCSHRRLVGTEEWRATIQSEVREHPILARLHEDPFSSYGYRKPRGYPGDAVLIDFIYGGGTSTRLVAEANPLGVALYRECMEHPSFAALRGRRDYLAAQLTRVCRSRQRPHILSVACGHLREADVLREEAERPGRFVALDQDFDTLTTAQADHPEIEIDPAPIPVLTLLRSGHELGAFDFIYSAGLYDYLSSETASRLTSKLASMLIPGGRLLIANMMPNLPSAAYMEAVMDWWLIYRTTFQLKSLSAGLGAGFTVTTCRRPYVAYMEIEKQAQ